MSFNTSPKKINFDFGEYKFNAEINYLLNQTKDGGFTATNYSFVSENKQLIDALSTNADSIKSISKEKWNLIQDEYRFVDAEQLIVKESKNYDFLMLNEAHFIPQHRNFVRRLLPELTKNGYKYLALEGINRIKNGLQYDQEF